MNTLQQRIIQELQVKSIIDPTEEIRKRIDFLKDYLVAHPFLKSYVLGISGGQDSTLAGKLAQLAIEELRAETGEAYQFIAIRLPYGIQNDEVDAKKALKFIQPDQSLMIDIKPIVDATVQTIEQSSPNKVTDFNKGNIKARQRMVTQYAVAGDSQGAVIGTDHAAENVTGFFTKFGDGAADVVPLFGLTKNQGRQLLKALGADAELYEKIPTADLEDKRPMLSDEEALGVSYEKIDAYLQGGAVDSKSQEIIEQWFLKTEHKRHLPITLGDSFWKQ